MARARDPDDSDPRPVHRRGFFTEGFRHLLKPLADLVEKRMQHFELPPEFTETESAARPSAPGPGTYGYAGPGATETNGATLLRPPGALPEGEFLARCTSCGKCVEACPVRAIRLVASDDPRKNLKPAIEASRQACVICDDLACMKACPTGALQLVGKRQINMGRAVVETTLCLRTKGEDCRICVDKCPIGIDAIDIPYAGAQVTVKDACTGCGVCEMYCPTSPRAIVIEPREEI